MYDSQSLASNVMLLARLKLQSCFLKLRPEERILLIVWREYQGLKYSARNLLLAFVSWLGRRFHANTSTDKSFSVHLFRAALKLRDFWLLAVVRETVDNYFFHLVTQFCCSDRLNSFSTTANCFHFKIITAVDLKMIAKLLYASTFFSSILSRNRSCN